MANSTLLILIAASFTFAAYFLLFGKKSTPPPGTKYPPGPPGKPLVGNLPDIPPQHSWLKFKEWADQYGPLMRLTIAGREHYVASTDKVANDLLRERGGIYSSREQLPAAAKLLSDDLRLLFMPHNDKWRDGRKLMHHVLNANVVPKYESTQLLESARMLRDLIREPTQYEHWFERYSAGLISRLAFGKAVETGHEPEVRNIIKVVHTVERVASPGAYLVDTFPMLMYLPKAIAPFKQELDKLHQRELNLFRGLLNDVKEEMKTGTAPPSWNREYLERKDQHILTEDEGAYVAGILFEAGAGTTAAAMMSFMLAIVHHPEWLSKLQKEVDTVCGSERMPNLADTPQLPIVRAVVKETLRWRPVTAGGVPHYSTKNDVYEGMFIPAGTNVHANQWAIQREPSLYPDPEAFKPERWLEPSYPTYREPLTLYPNLHNYSCFGVGRRICPGQNLAERSLILQVSRIVWACDVCRAKDKSGREISPPLYDYTAGFNVQPKWFPFELVRRDEGRVAVLEAEIVENGKNDPLGKRN